MTRTAHHLRLPRHDTWGTPGGGPLRTVVLYDLRYSARVLAEAAEAGRRPRPRRVRRRVAVHWLPRHGKDTQLTVAANLEERRARQALRARLTALRHALDAAGTTDAADSVDVPPARHRRGVLWIS
ncbi:hypothetical protein ACVW0K_003936 [Streptomyces filamentosus]|uniref:hypothetical protein n=1 Tax=Streptomyces filamentosus TaxID=67294 RepID=UPI0036EF9820